MEEKRSPVFAGVGGAALAAALVAVGGHRTVSPPEGKSAGSAIVQRAGDHPDITSNQEGPWYAFCQEYATTEFDHGDDPSEPRGIKGHQVPEEAEDGTAEITRNIVDKKGRPEVEKFNVRKHTVGELSSCVPDGEKLRVLIAMVPDPNATQMRLDFDRDIAAIQKAAAAEHYLYTRYWFPWRDAGWSPEKGDDPDTETRRRQEPGILCFRRQGEKKLGNVGTTERLFVLMVGETPTSGANRIQFAHALAYDEELTGRRLTGEAGISARPDIDISGPHFSASFKAIRDVLKKVKTEHQNAAPERRMQLQVANLISPDASGSEFISEFRGFCASEGDLCQLRTLSLPSNEVRRKTLEFLGQLGYRSRDVAQLSEDESAFGVSLVDSDPHDALKPGAPPNPDYELKLHFPRDLSSARNLSDEESAKVAAAGSKYLSLPGATLPTQLSASEPIDRDSPPAFGEEQAPAEVARSLSESVQEMRTHRIRAVVISASNPLDRIYLLEYLHNQLPDVRAVTIDADNLELDRPQFVDLTGSIAVTSMPLLGSMANRIEDPNKAQSPDSTDESSKLLHVSFVSSRQEGEFLAIETLLDGNLRVAEQTSDQGCLNFSLVGGTGYRMISSGAVEQGRLHFPCQVQQSGSSSDAVQRGTPFQFLTTKDRVLAPRVFITLIGAVFLFNLAHWWCLFSSHRGIERVFSYVSTLVPRLEPRRVFLLFAINNQIFLLDILVSRLAYAYHVPSVTTGGRDIVLETLFWILLLATIVSLAISGHFARRVWKEIRSSEYSADMKGQAGFSAFYLLCGVVMIFTLPITGDGEGIFLERLTHLGDGLSPVMPISTILLGYYLWSWVQLRRLEWSASRKAHLQFDEAMSGLLHTSIASLEHSLDELNPAQPRVVWACLVLAFGAGVVLRESLNGFDGAGFFCWFIFFGVTMLLFTVALTSAHAWSIWRRIRDLLTLLGGTSMSATFKNLTDRETMQVKIWDLAKSGKNFKVLQKTAESIGHLHGRDSEVARTARKEVDLLLCADAHHRQPRPGQIDELSDALNSSMNEAVKTLFAENCTGSRREDELQAYLALRLVALIRYGMLHIGVMIRFVAYGFVLSVFSIMFYPFEGRKTIGELLMLSFFGLVAWIATMMLQFQRNEMLSHLEGSRPGEANYWQTVLHLLTVGGLPLFAVLSSQFPGIANVAYTFFRPLLGVLH